MHFVYIKLPPNRRSRTDWHSWHATVESALSASGTGELLSWGGSIAPQGQHIHRLDIGLRDLEIGLDVLRETLLAHLAPDGTELHFTDRRGARQQSLLKSVWGKPEESTATHLRPQSGEA